MARKGDNLDLRFHDGDVWELLRPYPYIGKRWRGVVPRGFMTDFASVPRAFWPVLPPTGQYGPAAVIHDYLYRNGLTSRADADWTFREAMERLGVGWFTRQTMYLAVRSFGWAAYHAPPESEPSASE